MSRADHLRQAELWRALAHALQDVLATQGGDGRMWSVGVAYREARRHEQQAAQLTELPTAA